VLSQQKPATLVKMSSLQGFGSWRHLAIRFFGALSPVGPAAADQAWALSSLLPGEEDLWHRMSGPDQRHAIGVARDTIKLLAPNETPRDVIAAALLHDIGKVESSFGTFARVGVTLAALVVGRTRLLRWSTGVDEIGKRSLRARVHRYLTHDRLGAQLLEAAGSEALTISWAGEHHLAAELWTIDPLVSAALKAADGD
jgi:hypothetical protein